MHIYNTYIERVIENMIIIMIMGLSERIRGGDRRGMIVSE
jgi:hypothetical protein